MEQNAARLGRGVIEAVDDKNRMPLNYASRMDLYPHTRILLDHGANIEAVESKTKRTILLNAIYWNRHKVLPLLLAHGARTDVHDPRNETLLHHIARFGDLETLRIMAEHSLGNIDLDAGNIFGLTALEVFDSTDARCSPEDGNERGPAAKLFSAILRKARRGSVAEKDSITLEWVQEVGVTEPKVNDRTVGEKEQAHKDDGDNDDDDANDVFYDAGMEIASVP